MMRNACMLAVASLALVACNNTPAATDAGGTGDSGPLVDVGPPQPDTGAVVDTGVARDVGHDAYRDDANFPPYDGGTPAMCTGLTPLTISGYCAAYADAYVALYRRCGLVADSGAAELHAALLAGCDTTNLQNLVTGGSVHFDGARAACCFAHTTMDSTCYGTPGNGVAECADFITGTVANGGSCVSGSECANGYCHFGATCPGTCTAYAAPGTRCDVGDVTCDPNSTCDSGYNGATNVCVTQTGGMGASCNAAMGMGCMPDFQCFVPDGATMGTCRPMPHRGQSCDTNDILCDLRSGICDYDYASGTGVCVPQGASGSMRCIIDAQCAADLYCDGADFRGMVYGTCRPRAHRGESCATATCLIGLTCLPSGMCGDAPHVGEACNANTGCVGGFCATGSGMCVVGRTTGTSCTANEQCASGNCNAMTHTCAADCTP
jgi:hypothetical protein